MNQVQNYPLPSHSYIQISAIPSPFSPRAVRDISTRCHFSYLSQRPINPTSHNSVSVFPWAMVRVDGVDVLDGVRGHVGVGPRAREIGSGGAKVRVPV